MGRLIETTQDEKTLSYYKYYETGLPEIPAERLALAAAPQPVGRGIPFDEKDDFILFPADKDYCYVGYGENEDGSMIEFKVVEDNGDGYFNIAYEGEENPERWAYCEELEVLE